MPVTITAMSGFWEATADFHWLSQVLHSLGRATGAPAALRISWSWSMPQVGEATPSTTLILPVWSAQDLAAASSVEAIASP